MTYDIFNLSRDDAPVTGERPLLTIEADNGVEAVRASARRLGLDAWTLWAVPVSGTPEPVMAASEEDAERWDFQS